MVKAAACQGVLRSCVRILCSQFVAAVLALPEEGLASLPSRAFADFVVCLHSQKTHVAALRDMSSEAKLDKVLNAAQIELVWSCLPTPELEAIQQELLRTESVAGMRATMQSGGLALDTWWARSPSTLTRCIACRRS